MARQSLGRNLIDHSSPFALANATGEDLSDGLSYGLIGNESLYLCEIEMAAVALG